MKIRSTRYQTGSKRKTDDQFSLELEIELKISRRQKATHGVTKEQAHEEALNFVFVK